MLLDIDDCSSNELSLARTLSREILFYTNDMSLKAQKPLVLHKHAHAKEILYALIAAEKHLHALNQSTVHIENAHIESTTNNTLDIRLDTQSVSIAYS
jgi:hypothetical protein